MRPLLTVITLTYNQEGFLSRCLEGVRTQEGDFELEHIVVDDASTDRTAEILQSYQAHRLTVIRHADNKGANYGMAEAYGLANGKYIATCEGDDFWTAPDKLRTQVALMERRPDVAMCFHDATIVHEDKMHWPVVRPAIGAPIQNIEDLLHDNRAHTCTVMYRRIPGLEYPEWYTKFTVGDWPNHAFHAARGAIAYIPRAMAAYRLHGAGSWSTLKDQERAEQLAGMLSKLDAHFLFRYSDVIQGTIARLRSDAGLLQAA